MKIEHEYPRWQEPLAAAILEFNPRHLHGKAQRAEEAIANRMQELGRDKNNARELRLLFDGLSILRGVKQYSGNSLAGQSKLRFERSAALKSRNKTKHFRAFSRHNSSDPAKPGGPESSSRVRRAVHTSAASAFFRRRSAGSFAPVRWCARCAC
jgi:hypothetical protein